MSNDLSKEAKEKRVLAVLYRLSNGTAGVPINKMVLLGEINRLGVMNMDEVEFEAFRSREVLKARAQRN